jgi:c-di-GMP-binding flagellar brake protein YcgR
MIKFLYILVFFPNLAFAVDRINRINQYWVSREMSPMVIIGIALLIIAIVSAIVWSEWCKGNEIKNMRRGISWRHFIELVNGKLKDDELDLLKQALEQFKDAPPDQVISAPILFEKMAENYFQHKRRKYTEDQLELWLNIREGLGVLRLPEEIPYASTRNLTVLDRLVTVREGHGIQVEILMVTEATFVAKAIPGVKVGEWIRFSLTRQGDAEYRFETEVVELKPGQLFFKHTIRLERRQLRNWVRIDFKTPVKVYFKEDSEEKEFAGTTQDVSGGGMSFVLPEQLKKSKEIEVSFVLGQNSLVGKDKYKKVLSRVIRVANKPLGNSNLYKHSIEFVELEQLRREDIVRFIFDNQRKDLREKFLFGNSI